MTAITTPFGSAGAKYKFMGSATLINCYSEVRQDASKGQIVILPSPGMVEFAEWSDTPCRGAIYLEDEDFAIVVNSRGAWKVVESGTTTFIGTVPGLDPVTMCRNKKSDPQIVIRCDAGVYVIEDDSIQRLFNEEIQGCVWVEEQGGYIIYLLENGRFYISQINEATEIDPLDFATAESSADKGVAVKAIGNEIALIGQYTTEIWRNTATNPDFPFEPIGGATMMKGALSANSIADFDNSYCWVGMTKQGDRYVYRRDSYSAIKISTPEVDRLIAAETSPEDIEGMSYSMDGHAFYTLTGTNFSATYDAATKQWHMRQSYQQPNWRARSAFSAWNKIIVGDRLSGGLFYLASDTFYEDGQPLIWKLRPPNMNLFPNGGIIDAVSFDMLTGQGKTLPSEQGFIPKMMLRVSKDGGNTFGSERIIELGKQGNYQTRVVSRRHGRFGPQGADWEISISDPVGRGLALMDAKVRPLAR